MKLPKTMIQDFLAVYGMPAFLLKFLDCTELSKPHHLLSRKLKKGTMHVILTGQTILKPVLDQIHNCLFSHHKIITFFVLLKSGTIEIFFSKRFLGNFLIFQEDVEYEGCLRFFLAHADNNFTKAVRITSSTTWKSLKPDLLEKFNLTEGVQSGKLVPILYAVKESGR